MCGSITEVGFVEKYVGACVEAFGGLDIIVNNARYTWDNFIGIGGRTIKVGVNAEIMGNLEHAIPLGRVGKPAEAAGAVYLLCAPESD